MRDILFRGKRTDNGEWVEGYFVFLFDITKGRRSYRIYTEIAETDCGDFYPDWYEVDPETVGQFTGLRDVHSKPIFEGDIIRTKKYGKSVCYPHPAANITVNTYTFDTFSVVYSPAVFRVERDSPPRAFNLVGNGEDYEVIGNIHDNPKLLGGDGEWAEKILKASNSTQKPSTTRG